MSANPIDPHPKRASAAKSTRTRRRDPLDVAVAAFAALVTGPGALCLDGHAVGHGLPARPIPLDELRSVLLHPSTDYHARDAAWVEIVRLARSGDPAWKIGAVGVAMPGLRRVVSRLGREFPPAGTLTPAEESDDVCAEVLTGFLAALAGIDTDAGHIAGRLCWAAYRAGRLRCRREAGEARHRAWHLQLESLPPSMPFGHPDLVLVAAVDEGAITMGEASLIAATRIDGLTMRELAAQLGVEYELIRKWRSRAERRLVEFIRTGQTRMSHPRPKKGLDGCGNLRDGAPVTGRPSGADTPTHQPSRQGGDAHAGPATGPETRTNVDRKVHVA